MLIIDGSHGEGGGQILRSSLALSMCTGTPFRIEKIRAGRKKPGLMRQHLTAVNAAMQVCGAGVEGNAIGSTQLTFHPGNVRAGEYHFAVGTAGSTTLVFQTILPALLCANGSSELSFEGGTHNPFAPPFDFLERSFLPLVNKMGPHVTATLERSGFYPAGGGKFAVNIEPSKTLTPLHIPERGEIRKRSATALIANLPRHIAERELNLVGHKTGWGEDSLHVREIANLVGPGNIVMLEVECEHVTEVFTGFGEVNISAEAVANKAVDAYRNWFAGNVPIGEYLADQLLLLLAITGSGSFTTLPLSRHCTTHIDLIRRFLDLNVNVTTDERGAHHVSTGFQ